MRELPDALAPLSAYKQFIVYMVQPSRTRAGKSDKFPLDFRTGKVANAHDAAIWTDAATAIAYAAHYGPSYGVGFVFTEQDPFCFLDIDGCMMPDGKWSPIAMQLATAMSGAAFEVSQSGQGLHGFGTYRGQMPAHACKNESLHLELYHTGRFVALTGAGAVGSAAFDLTAVLPALIAQYFPPDDAQLLEQGWTDAPTDDWRGPTDDDELIRRALRSQSTAGAFGGKARFADLWLANMDALCAAYPDPDRGYNASQADAALAQHLAFWTGKDCERIERLMGLSALKRDKWEREDYLPRTIMGAVARQFDVLTDKAVEPVPDAQPVVAGVAAAQPQAVTGSTFLGAADQCALFAGCVYISDIHRVLVPGGKLLKPDQFRVSFGGYTFTMDAANEKTSRDAWEAFTQNQAFRCIRADSQCFRPDLPPATVIEKGGVRFANTFWPVDVPRKVGDAGPFLAHLAKVLPDQRDAYILLCYMAACVQHMGVKFQWAPLLQGVEGNGKTLFTRCVMEAIGERYIHMPPASEISEKFNAWLFGKIFIGVEDVFVTHDKTEVFEILKPMITSNRLAKRAMQTDQIMDDVSANFIFNSNHKDGLRKTENDRRICPLFCAQQDKSHIDRDGMGGDYFPKLYAWLRDDGYAIVAELLHTFPIPDEYNPATGCQRAPVTTSTQAAIVASQGGIEQEVQEAIAQGSPGFCGGWISSIMLDRLLERIGAARRLTHSKRKEMLDTMGYGYHPALHDGRVNNPVMPDGGKPRLFVRRDAPAWGIEVAGDAAKAYEAANCGHRVPFPLT